MSRGDALIDTFFAIAYTPFTPALFGRGGEKEDRSMEMGSKKEVQSIRPQGEVYQCPSCKYSDGFHLSFKWNPEDSDGEIYLICPNCHSRFRMGWRIKNPSKEKEGLTDFEIHSY